MPLGGSNDAPDDDLDVHVALNPEQIKHIRELAEQIDGYMDEAQSAMDDIKAALTVAKERGLDGAVLRAAISRRRKHKKQGKLFELKENKLEAYEAALQ